MNSEYSPSATLKPANSIVASEGIGRQALSPTISRKTPSSPISRTTSTAKLTIGSVIDAKTTPRRVARRRAKIEASEEAFDPRQRQRRDALLRALRRAADVGLGPQHLEDHHGLVDVRGDRRPVGDVIGREPLRDARRRAGDDQLAPARAQRSGRLDEAREHRVGDADGLGQVQDQPADPAGEGGFDPPPELTRVPELALHVDLVHDVVEPVLAERERTRLRYGTQGLGSEHGSMRRRKPASRVFPAPRARQACNCAINR